METRYVIIVIKLPRALYKKLIMSEMLSDFLNNILIVPIIRTENP